MYLALILVILSVVTSSMSQTYRDSSLQFADALFKKQAYTSALLEYQRCTFSKDSTLQWITLFRIGKTLQRLARYEASDRIFEQIINGCKDSSDLPIQAHIELVKNCIQRFQHRLGTYELEQIKSYPQTHSYSDEVGYLAILLDAHQYKLDSALSKIKTVSHDNPYYSQAQTIQSLICSYKAKEFKSPQKAELFSAIIPGSGQWYCGEKAKGIKMFFLISGLTALVGYSGYEAFRATTTKERAIAGMDCCIVATIGLRRYYSASKRKAMEAAILSNRNLQVEYQEALSTVENFSTDSFLMTN